MKAEQCELIGFYRLVRCSVQYLILSFVVSVCLMSTYSPYAMRFASFVSISFVQFSCLNSLSMLKSYSIWVQRSLISFDSFRYWGWWCVSVATFSPHILKCIWSIDRLFVSSIRMLKQECHCTCIYKRGGESLRNSVSEWRSRSKFVAEYMCILLKQLEVCVVY